MFPEFREVARNPVGPNRNGPFYERTKNEPEQIRQSLGVSIIPDLRRYRLPNEETRGDESPKRYEQKPSRHVESLGDVRQI